eukprot:3589156-Prymnesium_polylepis.1
MRRGAETKRPSRKNARECACCARDGAQRGRWMLAAVRQQPRCVKGLGHAGNDDRAHLLRGDAGACTLVS